jgi:hypothetical protein
MESPLDMNPIDLDTVHDLLVDVEESLAILNCRTGDRVESWHLAGLTTAFLELYGGHIHYGSPEARELGVPPKLANSLIKPNAEMRLADAIILGNRLRSRLVTLESELGGSYQAPEPTPSAGAKDDITPDLGYDAGAFASSPAGWAPVPLVGPTKVRISQLSQLLEDIVYSMRSSNLPSEERALSELERAQLITMLETVLQVLKAPMIERSLLQKCGEWLSRAGKRVAQRKTEETLGTLADKAGQELTDLIEKFPWPNG